MNDKISGVLLKMWNRIFSLTSPNMVANHSFAHQTNLNSYADPKNNVVPELQPGITGCCCKKAAGRPGFQAHLPSWQLHQQILARRSSVGKIETVLRQAHAAVLYPWIALVSRPETKVQEAHLDSAVGNGRVGSR